MSQNLAAQVARGPSGGAEFLNTDSQGQLLVALGGASQVTVADYSDNSANANAVAALPAVVGQTNSLSGFIISGTGATAAGGVLATVEGLIGGTMTIPVAVPAGANVAIQPIIVNLTQPIPASAANVAITLTLPALGAGNTRAAVSLWGEVG